MVHLHRSKSGKGGRRPPWTKELLIKFKRKKEAHKRGVQEKHIDTV